jgi:hypothetical protein
MTRQCGGCTLCCKLTPVKELEKAANTRCEHQRSGKGCAIYEKRPRSCALWNCQWLGNPEETAALSRPDRAHYVIDILPDFVTLRRNDNGETMDIPVWQVWVDPKFPDAHREPAFRAWVMKQGERGYATLIRYGERDGFTIFPPNMATDGQWHEEGTAQSFTREKSLIDMVRDGEFKGLR